MINLEIPKKFDQLVEQAHQVATEVFRPNSRKYDSAEHEYPKELDMLAAVIDGMNEAGALGGAGRRRGRRRRLGRRTAKDGRRGNRNGSNMASLLGLIELCWGDVGLLLTMPRQGLGQAAIAAVADEEQLERFGGKWAAMAITEPEAAPTRRRSAPPPRSTRTTRVRAQRREDLRHLRRPRRAGRGLGDARPRRRAARAIKSFVVERDNPGLKLDRLEHKLGIRASDTANFVLDDCRVPKENLLGSPEIDAQGRVRRRDADLRQHPPAGGRDGRSAWPAPAWSARASCSRRPASRSTTTSRRTRRPRPPPEFIAMESDWEAARLLTLQAAWMADNRKPNSLQASMAKAKAGPRRHRHRAALRGAGGLDRLRRGRAAREVGARREDPRHLRGHPADPAADRRPPAAGDGPAELK